MIVAVAGVLESAAADHVVVNVGGVSLKASVPGSTLAKLPSTGERVRLHTHLYVREDALALFGFSTPEELHLFEVLLTVSGVGPRLALSLLTGLSVDSLQSAIAAGNADMLTQAPGVGKKLAARLVLELKGKVAGAPGMVGTPGIPAGENADVLAALTALGYSATEAATAITTIAQQPGQTVEDRIRLALRQLASA